jgi:AcrR family transcriptional regulator
MPSTKPGSARGRKTNVQGRLTRKLVLDAAGKLFAQQGYEGAGFREISSESGAGLSSIIYHFGNKKNLYLETIRHLVVENARLDAHFEVFDPLEYGDRQAVSDAIREAIRSFLGACHGPQRTPYVIELYARIMVDGDDEALAVLLEAFAGVQQKLPVVVKRIRPDFPDRQVAFWIQSFWAQLQYTVMGKRLILFDMQMGSDYPEWYLDEAAWHMAWWTSLPLGLPEPSGRPQQL